MEHEFKDIEEYYGWFLSDHRKSATRWCHFVGNQLGVVLGIFALVGRRRRLLSLAVALGAGLPVGSHFLIEKNRPRNYGHSLWVIRCDARMIGAMWRGGDADLGRRAAVIYAERQHEREQAELSLQSYERDIRAPLALTVVEFVDLRGTPNAPHREHA